MLRGAWPFLTALSFAPHCLGEAPQAPPHRGGPCRRRGRITPFGISSRGPVVIRGQLSRSLSGHPTPAVAAGRPSAPRAELPGHRELCDKAAMPRTPLCP